MMSKNDTKRDPYSFLIDSINYGQRIENKLLGPSHKGIIHTLRALPTVKFDEEKDARNANKYLRKTLKQACCVILGKSLFEINSKPNYEVISVLNRINSDDYKVIVLSSYGNEYFVNNGIEKTEEVIQKISTKILFSQKIVNDLRIEFICKVLLDMTDRPKLNVHGIVSILRLCIKFDEKKQKKGFPQNIHRDIILKLKQLISPDELLSVIRSFEKVGLDEKIEPVYIIADSPEKVDLYSEELCSDVYSRIYNDWLIWACLSLNFPSFAANPSLRFKFILSLSRFSDYQNKLKLMFLHDLIDHFISLSRVRGNDLFNKCLKINSEFKQSEQNKDLIEFELKKKYS